MTSKLSFRAHSRFLDPGVVRFKTICTITAALIAVADERLLALSLVNVAQPEK